MSTNLRERHRNRKHPQLWRARDNRLILRTTAPYAVGFSSPPFERLDVRRNLFPVIAIGICHRDRGAVAGVDHWFLWIKESTSIIPEFLSFR